MKVTLKGLALCGLCALLAGVGSAASAQDDFHHGDGHGGMRHARHAIMRQKMDYARAIAHGNYRAAERAHMRARMIRHHIRARRRMMFGDHGY